MITTLFALGTLAMVAFAASLVVGGRVVCT